MTVILHIWRYGTRWEQEYPTVEVVLESACEANRSSDAWPESITKLDGTMIHDHDALVQHYASQPHYLMAAIDEADAELRSFHRVLHRENIDTQINNLARDGGRP